MSGDALARGAKSATFTSALVTQEKWDSIWEEDPLHGKTCAKVTGSRSGLPFIPTPIFTYCNEPAKHIQFGLGMCDEHWNCIECPCEKCVTRRKR